MPISFRLKIRRVEQSCIFDLLDPAGQEYSATLKYPEQLTELYQTWRRIYQRRYQLKSRAKFKSQGGSGTPPAYDWDRELNLAETAFLQAFERWLGQAELLNIRARIQQPFHMTAQQWAGQTEIDPPDRTVNLLVECAPLDLARLPWETWNLAPQEVAPEDFRILRTVTTEVTPVPTTKKHRSQARFLVIFGDAPDLQPDSDRKALRSLSPWVDMEFVPCQVDWQTGDPQQAIAALKHRIATAIADQRGWDGLVFVGHSDESPGTGGKLELAPGVSLAIWEIEAQLAIAIQRGLRLAIFNSCSGLQIAEALIRLGVSQVLVMRETIQDQVAHQFLQQLCQQVTRYQTISTALQRVYRYFQAEQISYPSAHLIPSLYCHPDLQAAVFQIEPAWLKRFWQQWRLTRREAIVLGILSLLSLVTPVRELLLDYRYWVQAVYHQATHHSVAPPMPPVTLIAIDQASIERGKIDSYKVNPMDRAYLAKLVARLHQLNAKVIGLDYFLDGATKEDLLLSKTIRATVQNHKWMILATKQDAIGQQVGVNQRVANPAWILQGDTLVEDWNLMRPPTLDCQLRCPFAYQLASAFILQQADQQKSPLPSVAGDEIPLQQKVSAYFQQPENEAIARLKPFYYPVGVTPILDFSLPPAQVFQKIAAWIIASGGYDQADDNFSLPLAITFWRSQSSQSAATQLTAFSGGEAHAYAVHHWLSRHRVVRIPDLWLLGVAMISAKAMAKWQRSQVFPHQRRSVLILGSIPLLYGCIVLPTYMTAGVLIPWFLPTLLFWSYCIKH
jgi:CHASE2 domain